MQCLPSITVSLIFLYFFCTVAYAERLVLANVLSYLKSLMLFSYYFHIFVYCCYANVVIWVIFGFEN
jgi:hypothetical protein